MQKTIHSPEDLLQEAIERTLTSARSLKKGMDLFFHLKQTMRSIADSWLRQAQIRQRRFPSGNGWDSEGRARAPDLEGGTPVTGSGNQCLPKDSEIIHLLLELQSQLKVRGSPAELGLLNGLVFGSSADELQQQLRLSPHDYKNALRRVRHTALKVKREEP